MTSNWVSSSFSRKRTQKERGDGKGNLTQESGSIEPKTQNLWTDMFEPTKEEELAVNSKKIQQAKNWLKSALAGELGKSPMAVFSGPSGSGKTATIRVLSKSMEVNLREWTCPSTTATATYTETQGEGRFDYDSSAQVKQFEEFLFRASRYSTVFDDKDAAKSILIVEDIPNVYLHNPSFFQKSLHKYSDYGLSPIIFIMYSSGSQDLERLFFKPQLVKDLSITIISFNPTCRSLMFKALWRIAHLAHLSLDLTLKASIEQVAAIANSDVRFAVNQLQFLVYGAKGPDSPYVHKSKVKRRKEPKKKSKKGEKPSTALALRDPSTDVFRCIGRVLYCKKEMVVDVKTRTVKEQLSHDPFQIVRSMSSSPNLYLGLLSENYPFVFNDIKRIAEASESICRAENIMTSHMNSEIRIEYGLSVSVLGLMNSSSENITRRFNPFRGSRAKEAFYACNEKLQTCKSLFPGSIHSPRTLLTDVLPFISKIGTSRLPEDKRNFIRGIAEFTSDRFVPTTEYDGPGPSSACVSVSERPRVDPKFVPTTEDDGPGPSSACVSVSKRPRVDPKFVPTAEYDGPGPSSACVSVSERPRVDPKFVPTRVYDGPGPSSACVSVSKRPRVHPEFVPTRVYDGPGPSSACVSVSKRPRVHPEFVPTTEYDGPGPSSACVSVSERPRVDPNVKIDSRVLLKTDDDDDDDDVVIIEQNYVPAETADNEDDEVMIIDVRVPIKLKTIYVEKDDDDVIVIDDDDDDDDDDEDYEDYEDYDDYDGDDDDEVVIIEDDSS